MRTARRQFTGELKREAVGLLASSGRPLGQIARERGDCRFKAARLAGCRRELGRRSRVEAAPRRSRILRDAVAKRPILLWNFQKIHQNVFRPDAIVA
jgi:hypothetical protein